jgi:hypothetical protein
MSDVIPFPTKPVREVTTFTSICGKYEVSRTLPSVGRKRCRSSLEDELQMTRLVAVGASHDPY